MLSGVIYLFFIILIVIMLSVVAPFVYLVSGALYESWELKNCCLIDKTNFGLWTSLVAFSKYLL